MFQVARIVSGRECALSIHTNVIGLTDPKTQYQYYPAMAISTNGHKAAVGALEHGLMEAAVKPCVAGIEVH